MKLARFLRRFALGAAILVLTGMGGVPSANAQTPPAPVVSTAAPAVSKLDNVAVPPPTVGVYQSPSQRPEAGLMASDAELLRALAPTRGIVSIPDKNSATLIQPAGRDWRATVKGPIRVIGSWLLLGMCCALIAFYLLRGKIMVDSGISGRQIMRFTSFERFVHWMTAGAFIVLAISGLNITYGRYMLLPLLGPDSFAALSVMLKYFHNYLSFAFMLGIVLMFVMWARHNIPTRHDLQWISVGGGLFTKGTHPPADKFNAGQKVIFWTVVVGGVALSVTGVWLLFPFIFGDVSLMQTMQIIHAIVALVLTAVIIAHIYIGSVGMEQAFDAMGTGLVDVNWAKEHHGMWLAKEFGEKEPKFKMGSD